MRKLEEYRIKDFAFDEQRWRIDWLGAVTFAERYRRASQPLIEVQLSCIPENISSLDALFVRGDGESRTTRQVRLPVAFLPMLRIGDIWENGYLIESPAYDVVDFPALKIDRNSANIIKSGLSAGDEGNYYLPWEHHPFHMRHTQSYCVLVSHGDVKIIVPATELIRFYFGSSGDLIARLFDAPFEEAKFWNLAEPADMRGNAKINLASGISCRSASTVARMAFSFPARHAAEIIGKSCIAATANGQRAYPKALFPIEGHTDLTASGRWLPFKGVERGVFLVFQLLSCSHHFPFSGLHYTGERKNAPNGKTSFGTNARSEADAGATRYSRKLKEAKSVVDAEPDKNKKIRDISLDPAKREQFPDLCKKRIAKVDIDFGPTVVMTANGSSNIVGVSAGDAGTDLTIRPIDFVAAGPAMEAATGIATKLESAVAIFLGLISTLAPEPRFMSVDIVRLDRRQRHDYLCTLPQIVDEDGVIHPWCLFGDDKAIRSRKISIARAQEPYVTHFILIPELPSAANDAPRELELHIISDGSRSISREAELLVAITVHLARATVPSVRTHLGEGVESIKYNLTVPSESPDSNYSPAITTARALVMTFAESNQGDRIFPEAESIHRNQAVFNSSR